MGGSPARGAATTRATGGPRRTRRGARLRRSCRPHRRGITAMLAMLYLVLFSTLAIGFYAATTTAVQVSANDERTARAALAAESGMEFMRHQMSKVRIPSYVAGATVTYEVASDLHDLFEGTGNFSGGPLLVDGSVISIPADPDKFIPLDAGGMNGFRATITDWPDEGRVVVKVDGRYGGTVSSAGGRAVQMDFNRVPKTSSVFDHAVASRGKIQMMKNSITSVDSSAAHEITMLSAMEGEPAIVVTGGSIGGENEDDPYADPTKTLTVIDGEEVIVTGGEVGGSSIPSDILAHHVEYVSDPPEFPTWDTAPYEGFATGTSTGAAGKSTITNVRVPAGSNPHFNGTATLNGIMYVESPNVVTINGTFNLNGYIVFENAGDSSVNQIVISGTMTQGELPSTPEFDDVRTATGVAILAPTAKLTASGNAKGTLPGNVVVAKVATDGNPADLIIKDGSLVVMEQTPDAAVFNGKNIKFTSTGKDNMPNIGMSFSETYAPEAHTYTELYQ